jgi:hypothetical protein
MKDKYRIVEVTMEGGLKKYKPQERVWFCWIDIFLVSFTSLEEAESNIQAHKDSKEASRKVIEYL